MKLERVHALIVAAIGMTASRPPPYHDEESRPHPHTPTRRSSWPSELHPRGR